MAKCLHVATTRAVAESLALGRRSDWSTETYARPISPVLDAREWSVAARELKNETEGPGRGKLCEYSLIGDSPSCHPLHAGPSAPRQWPRHIQGVRLVLASYEVI